MKVAEIIAKTLNEYQIDYVFLLTGGDQPLWIALKEAGVKMMLARSEQAATYMADGYARMSGKPTVTYGQYGPGVGNVAGALVQAWWGMSPVISLTTSIRTISKDRYEYQEFDQIPMHSSITKWNKYIVAPYRTADMLRSAIRHAMSPPPGPVHLELPSDFLAEDVKDPDIYAEESFKRLPSLRFAPDPELVKKAVRILTEAKKPLIIAGRGVILSEAWNELKSLAELLSIPVATSLAGKGSIPEDHKLSVGVIGRYSRKSANDIAVEADVVLAVGTRLGGLTTDTFKVPSRAARIIHIDIDPTCFGTNYREELSIMADAKLALQAILNEAIKQGIKVKEAVNWAEWAHNVTLQWFNEVEKAASTEGRPLHPLTVLRALNEVLKSNDVVVADTGYMGAWTGAAYQLKSMGKVYFNSNGSLGWAFPASLGVALAAQDRKVVSVIGDGGIGYHISELETALRLKIPVIVLVLNNNSLAFEYHEQKYNFGKVVSEVDDFTDVNYAEVAEKFGAKGKRVTKKEDLVPILEEAYEYNGPYLIDVIVDKEAYAPVTVYERVMKRII